MFEPHKHSYRQFLVTTLLALTGLLWASPHAWAQG